MYPLFLLFEAYRSPACDQFISKTVSLEGHLTICKERVKNNFLKKLYQLRDTLFDKLELFGIFYTDNQKLFNNMAIFDSETVLLENEKFKDTETPSGTGKHISILASTSSNSIQEPIFLCHPNPRDLIKSFTDALESLATHKKRSLGIQTDMKNKLARVLEVLSQRHSHYVGKDADDNYEISLTQFPQM